MNTSLLPCIMSGLRLKLSLCRRHDSGPFSTDQLPQGLQGNCTETIARSSKHDPYKRCYGASVSARCPPPSASTVGQHGGILHEDGRGAYDEGCLITPERLPLVLLADVASTHETTGTAPSHHVKALTGWSSKWTMQSTESCCFISGWRVKMMTVAWRDWLFDSHPATTAQDNQEPMRHV
jgi:hypothetical protein